jgi:hypothetical protein
MRPAVRIRGMKTTATIATAFLLVLLLGSSRAQADVGVESSSRRAGEPGDPVELTLGCGFCFPPCVGEPGHRHPPGDLHGVCMLDSRRGPPASFLIWLTPLKHSLKPYVCGRGEGCEPGSSRPPHLPSFIYLGRAVPTAPGGDEGHEVPRYRLVFGVPEAGPGRYKYVIFCDACVDGPRGSLIEDRTKEAGRLRVLPPVATAGGGGGGALPWIGAAALAALALGGGLLLLRSGANEPDAGSTV